jgi:viroplasmin and RNaseH domain-containing protein
MKNKYYAVANGRVPGIYYTWDECFQQVNKFRHCRFKSFKHLKDAVAFMLEGQVLNQPDTDVEVELVDGNDTDEN